MPVVGGDISRFGVFSHPDPRPGPLMAFASGSGLRQCHMVCGANSGPWSGESHERRELESVAMSGADGAGPTGGRVSEEEKRESRRSSVRIRVTYGAAAFLFLGWRGF